jgi:heavy metal-(Cd/Co/Hg/Pb/Zn)-translocating P-type ATPase
MNEAQVEHSRSVLTKTLCTHCDEQANFPLFNDEDSKNEHPFCCIGCMTVYNVINQKGLSEYYKIKNNSGLFKRRAPVANKKEEFKFLNEVTFLNEYARKTSDDNWTMDFYLEGVHCLACLWLIEKLPFFLKDVKTSRLDMSRSIATVTLIKDGHFSNVAAELQQLGYRPHPIKKNSDLLKIKEKENRTQLLRIGIAGAASGNIMIYAVSIYAGADGNFLKLFSFMTILLFFPVVFYSAIPFYQSAISAIKNKTVNIDVPIAIALVVGLLHGLFGMINGIHNNYFDTLTDLVFFLLLSRYILAKIQEKGLCATDLNFFYATNSVKKLENGLITNSHPRYLKEFDIIKVDAGEIIPIDGTITYGETHINNSLLTGESMPVKAFVGSEVFSGTLNLDSSINIKVLKTMSETRLGNILKEVESGWILKAKIVELTNRLSKYFIAAIFIIGLIVFVSFALSGDTKTGIDRFLTLLIVTCPCALALATPLALTNTLSRATERGMIIKNDEVIEKISKIKDIFLDKTGTLTFGQLKVDEFKIIRNSKFNPYDLILTLEEKSTHLVAAALIDFAHIFDGKKIQGLTNFREILGKGVEGYIEGHFFEIKGMKLLMDGDVLASFTLSDLIRPDSFNAIKKLKDWGITPHLLSGDREETAVLIGESLGIKRENIYFEITPEKKMEIISKSPQALMIGDGANDAMALSKAFVGVAVCGSMDISLRASDVYLTTPGIFPLIDLISISKETMKIIYRNLSISVLYNIISVIAVFIGIIGPLTAAIIMPASSLSVLFSTIIGTSELKKRLKV